MNILEEMNSDWDRNYDTMVIRDENAKADGKLVGRYVREPIADGYAYYKIVKVKKSTIDIKLITGIGDDYSIPYWGTEASVKKN